MFNEYNHVRNKTEYFVTFLEEKIFILKNTLVIVIIVQKVPLKMFSEFLILWLYLQDDISFHSLDWKATAGYLKIQNAVFPP